jgi:hypothetical protein
MVLSAEMQRWVQMFDRSIYVSVESRLLVVNMKIRGHLTPISL